MCFFCHPQLVNTFTSMRGKSLKGYCKYQSGYLQNHQNKNAWKCRNQNSSSESVRLHSQTYFIVCRVLKKIPGTVMGMYETPLGQDRCKYMCQRVVGEQDIKYGVGWNWFVYVLPVLLYKFWCGRYNIIFKNL